MSITNNEITHNSKSKPKNSQSCVPLIAVIDAHHYRMYAINLCFEFSGHFVRSMGGASILLQVTEGISIYLLTPFKMFICTRNHMHTWMQWFQQREGRGATGNKKGRKY